MLCALRQTVYAKKPEVRTRLVYSRADTVLAPPVPRWTAPHRRRMFARVVDIAVLGDDSLVISCCVEVFFRRPVITGTPSSPQAIDPNICAGTSRLEPFAAAVTAAPVGPICAAFTTVVLFG